MIDISNWSYLYKIDYEFPENETEPTNMLYTPMVNPEGTVLCMIWDEKHPYQSTNTKLTLDLVDFFFQRELDNLIRLQGYHWAPKIYKIEREHRRIFLEWNKRSLNNILAKSNNLDVLCPSWKEQLFQIVKGLRDAGYYKMSLYPHCFFINKVGVIKTIDFYACVGIKERYIPKEKLTGMIGPLSTDRFNLSTVGDQIDFKKFFDLTMNEFLYKTWKESNPFPEFYKTLFAET